MDMEKIDKIANLIIERTEKDEINKLMSEIINGESFFRTKFYICNRKMYDSSVKLDAWIKEAFFMHLNQGYEIDYWKTFLEVRNNIIASLKNFLKEDNKFFIKKINNLSIDEKVNYYCYNEKNLDDIDILKYFNLSKGFIFLMNNENKEFYLNKYEEEISTKKYEELSDNIIVIEELESRIMIFNEKYDIYYPIINQYTFYEFARETTEFTLIDYFESVKNLSIPPKVHIFISREGDNVEKLDHFELNIPDEISIEVINYKKS